MPYSDLQMLCQYVLCDNHARGIGLNINYGLVRELSLTKQ